MRDAPRMGESRSRSSAADRRAFPRTGVLSLLGLVPKVFESEAVSQQPLAHSEEDERLARSGPREVTLYTRRGCHMCEEAKAVIAPVLRESGATLRAVRADEDPALTERSSW